MSDSQGCQLKFWLNELDIYVLLVRKLIIFYCAFLTKVTIAFFCFRNEQNLKELNTLHARETTIRKSFFSVSLWIEHVPVWMGITWSYRHIKIEQVLPFCGIELNVVFHDELKNIFCLSSCWESCNSGEYSQCEIISVSAGLELVCMKINNFNPITICGGRGGGLNNLKRLILER